MWAMLSPYFKCVKSPFWKLKIFIDVLTLWLLTHLFQHHNRFAQCSWFLDCFLFSLTYLHLSQLLLSLKVWRAPSRGCNLSMWMWFLPTGQTATLPWRVSDAFPDPQGACRDNACCSVTWEGEKYWQDCCPQRTVDLCLWPKGFVFVVKCVCVCVSLWHTLFK